MDIHIHAVTQIHTDTHTSDTKRHTQIHTHTDTHTQIHTSTQTQTDRHARTRTRIDIPYTDARVQKSGSTSRLPFSPFLFPSHTPIIKTTNIFMNIDSAVALARVNLQGRPGVRPCLYHKRNYSSAASGYRNLTQKSFSDGHHERFV